MKDEHILDILDNGLNEENQAQVVAHADHCESCRQALEAAQISSLLLRTAEVFEPSPFFQQKVLKALPTQRERRNLRKPIEAFWRWWQASSPVVAVMIIMVISLIALTIFAPATNANQAQAIVTSDTLYSTEAVLLNQKSRGDLTNEQTLEILYETKK